jgi:hypothetical protein
MVRSTIQRLGTILKPRHQVEMVAELPKRQAPAMPGGGGMGGMDF